MSRHLHTRIPIVIACLVLWSSSPAGAAEPDGAVSPGAAVAVEDYVRFTLETGGADATPAATPYHTIRYEITRRQPATTAVHRRQLPGLDEGLHALGLLTPEESVAFFDLARRLRATTLTTVVPSKPRPGTLTWRCDLMIDGVHATFVAADIENVPDRRYARLFDAVRRTVLAHAGELPFRNVFFPMQERGWLNVESVPAAAVLIDGFDTKLTTPLYSYDIAAGHHTLLLRSPDDRFERTFDVRVEPQGTTTLRIDLR